MNAVKSEFFFYDWQEENAQRCAKFRNARGESACCAAQLCWEHSSLPEMMSNQR
jgi:hypothetical protein